MSKAVDLLENNVQWIAIGAGALFVGYVAYQYVGKQPTVTVGAQTFGAGEIDAHTAASDGPVGQLQGRMNASPPVPDGLKVPTYVGGFSAELKGPTTRPLASPWTAARGLSLDLPGMEGGTTPTTPTTPVEPIPGALAGNKVQELKPLAAPTPIGATSGLSTVNPATVVPAANANAGLLNPQAAPAEGAPRPAAIPGSVDRDWVTVAFEVPMESVSKEFQAANIPNGLLTTFLRVEVQREEQLPTGSWGKAVIVRPLTGSPLAQFPMPRPKDLVGENNYRTWAEANQVEILQPGFFAVLSGAQWTMPGQAAAALPGGQVFDPRLYLTGPIPNTLTKEQREQVMTERAKETKKREDEERQRRRDRGGRPPAGGGGGGGVQPGEPGFGGPGGPGGGGGRGGRGGAPRSPLPPSVSFAPNAGPGLDSAAVVLAGMFGHPSPGQFPSQFPAQLTAQFPGLLGSDVITVQQYIPPRPPDWPRGSPWPPPGYGGVPEPGMGQDTGPGMGMPGGGPQQSALNLGKLPSGAFDPLTWTGGNVITFQHDETVETGKTYRYRARYVMLSPVYQQPAATAKPEVAEQYRWESAWSDWTTTVQISTRVSFFTSRVTNGAGAAEFEVFQFLNGQMRSKTFRVTPGEAIGAKDATGDFTTGYTLVDVRAGTRGEGYALVMSPDGSVSRRDGSDTGTDRYKQLKQQAAAGAAVGQ